MDADECRSLFERDLYSSFLLRPVDEAAGTKLFDIAQLSLPNKLAGVAFGVLRSAFGWSVLLNLVGSYAADTLASATEGSRLYPPVVAMAPLVIPAVKESKWVQRTVDDIRDEVDRMIE